MTRIEFDIRPDSRYEKETLETSSNVVIEDALVFLKKQFPYSCNFRVFESEVEMIQNSKGKWIPNYDAYGPNYKVTW